MVLRAHAPLSRSLGHLARLHDKVAEVPATHTEVGHLAVGYGSAHNALRGMKFELGIPLARLCNSSSGGVYGVCGIYSFVCVCVCDTARLQVSLAKAIISGR